MKILVAPLHYVANKIDGSEYSRAYDYLKMLSQVDGISGDVIVGYMEEKRLGNFEIHSLFKQKPSHISIYLRLYFIFAVFIKSVSLIKSKSYNLIWHNGPFALGETFSLLSLWNKKRIPFLLGPVVTPHTYLGSDEAHSMGSKLTPGSNVLKLKQDIHESLYKLAKLFYPLSKLTLSSASYILTKDSVGLGIIKKLGYSNSQTMLLPTDLSRFYSAPKRKVRNKIHLLSVGYLVERKRTLSLIQAIKLVLTKYGHTNFILTIVGDGPEMQSVKNLVRSLKLEPYVKLAGYIPKSQISKYYRQADMFVSASVSESLPAMYYEAMASSLPIIMVDNASSLDLRKIHFGGLIVRPNDISNLASKINTLLNNPSNRISLGLKNYQLATSILSLPKQIINLVKIMNKVTKL